MSARTLIARLASAAVLLLASHEALATPTVSLFVSPGSIAVGGSASLGISISDDAGTAFTNGSLSIVYPTNVVNVGGTTFDNCGGSTSAIAGVGGVSVTNMAVAAFSSCFIQVPLTSGSPGTYSISVGPGSLTTSNGPNANSSTGSLVVVAPVVVTSTADSGAGSLRDAIATANGSCTPGLAIKFSISGPGGPPYTIQPASALPPITCSGLLIDGLSQPGSSANTKPALSGDNANLQVILNGSGCTSCNGFTVSGTTDVTIRGFAIRSFQGAGIEVDSNNTRIYGSYIGTDPGGMTSLGNGTGVHVSTGYAVIGSASAADHVLITGNGIGVHSVSGAVIDNIQVGGRRDGSPGFGNSGRGVFFNSSNSTSNSVNASRVLGNGAQGISVDAATLARVLIQGTVSFGNGGIGVDLNDDGPTANDEAGPPYDTDSGANRLTNYPVITSVVFDGFNTTVSGYVKSEAFIGNVSITLFTNSSLTTDTQGENILETFNASLDATGFVSFSRVYGGSRTNISAQMTQCGDGCTYSSEFSPSVAVSTTMSCNMAVQIPSVGDGVVTTPTVIAPAGAPVTIFPLCFTSPTSFSWSTGATTFQIAATAPAAGASATYTVNVSDGVGSGTFSVTLQGALAGTPVCNLSTSPALPLQTTVGTNYTATASCSPAATGYTWANFGGATTLVTGQGTASATFQVASPPEPGVGYHIYMDPSNAAGPGPSATRIIWFEQVAITAPASMDFGTIAAGTQSAPQSVTFQNLSSSNSAYFMNVSVSGPYVVTNNCPDPLPPSASCTIDIRFAPTVAGVAQSGNAVASYSFPGNPSKSISLTGSATGAPGVMFTPSSLTFAARPVSTTSLAQTITLTNNGTATLGISLIAITGDFAFTSGCGATLAPGATCSIDVTFTPLVAGARSGTLSVTDNASGTPHTVALSGSGLSATAAVLEPTPGAVVFSSQAVGTDSEPSVVIVTNSGTAPLTFSAISLSGEFRIVAPPAGSSPAACPVTLPPGGTCRIDLVFHPLGLNARSGTLAISSNGGNAALQVIGTGVVREPLQLQLPEALDFGPRAVGTRSPGQPVALHNISPYVANVMELTASGDFDVSDTCTTIAAGATCSVLVTFQPSALGPREGALTVRTLRDVEPSTVRLLGTGIDNPEPALELSVTQIGFGNTFVGQLVTHEVTLRNVGQAMLQVSAVVAGGAFFTDGACVGPIAPNATCTVHVTFSPWTSGGAGGRLQVFSNAPNSPHAVSLSGTGCFVPSPGRTRFGAPLCGS